MTLHGLSILATLFLMTGSSSAFSVQLKDNLLYEWNIDYDQSILLVKVTYRPDDEDILDTKGASQNSYWQTLFLIIMYHSK